MVVSTTKKLKLENSHVKAKGRRGSFESIKTKDIGRCVLLKGAKIIEALKSQQTTFVLADHSTCHGVESIEQHA